MDIMRCLKRARACRRPNGRCRQVKLFLFIVTRDVVKVKIFPFIYRRLRMTWHVSTSWAVISISMRKLAFLMRICEHIHCDNSADGNSSRDGDNSNGGRNNSGDGNNTSRDGNSESKDGNSESRCDGCLGCTLMRWHVGSKSSE
jgi:hypothetical protein